MQWKTIATVLLILLAGCSGGASPGEGSSGNVCVEGDYPSSASPSEIGDTLQGDWEVVRNLPMAMIPGGLRGYDKTVSLQVKSPVDGDEFVVSVYRYPDEETANNVTWFTYARENAVVIAKTGNKGTNSSMDKEGEIEDMLTSFQCISEDETA